MGNSQSGFGFVKKSGDTMSGDLAMAGGKKVDSVDISVLKAAHDSHVAAAANPHTVTKTQVGLANVLNKEQVAKDGSVAMSADLNMGTKAIVSVGNVDGVDISAIISTSFKQGTYLGNGVDNTDINIAVALAIKNDVILIIKSQDNAQAVFHHPFPNPIYSQFFTAVAEAEDRVKALTGNGFRLGTAAEVNANGSRYYYFVFWHD